MYMIAYMRTSAKAAHAVMEGRGARLRAPRPGPLQVAFNLSLLAAAHAAHGEPEQACHTGCLALDLTVGIHSARSVRCVRDLTRRLRPYAAAPAVRDFTAEARERLPAEAGHAAPR